MVSNMVNTQEATEDKDSRYNHVHCPMTRHYLKSNPPETVFDLEDRPTNFRLVELERDMYLEIDDRIPK